jgi:uncharacterized protein (DUF927 family)
MTTPSKKGRVRSAIQGAQAAPAAASPPPPPPPPSPSGAPSYLAGRFEMRAEGLFKKGDGDSAMWVCGPFVIEGETRDDEARSWGLLLSWRDRDGGLHEEAFARALFAGECGEVRARLADAGLSLNASQAARQALAEYLNVASSPLRARGVDKIGWHVVGGRWLFVLPDATFGTTPERVVLQAADGTRSLFNEAGALDDWRTHVGRWCVGNSRLAFAASCAFAAPLLGLVGEEAGGFNLRGDSRTGKSTALRVAASVCGGTPAAGGAGFVRAWRATGNALEGVAALHNDCLLPLDEMSQVDAREAGEIAYMLGNGQGKARAGRTGLVRPALRFRTLFLSTGEIGLAQKSAEGGRATHAGMEVRCCDIPANAGAGFGLFEELHGEASADAFARELNLQTTRNYGTPLRAFLTRATAELQRDPSGYVNTLRDRAADLSRRLLAAVPEATGQVLSVAGRFALVALGGELASAWLLTDWPAGEATAAVERCFRAWLVERGTVGAQEHAQAVMQLRSFIARHGAARFEDWKDREPPPGQQGDDAPVQPNERFRTGNRAGWRRWVQRDDDTWGWRYFLTKDGMNEALAGLAPREAKRTLADLGLIVASQADSDLAAGVLASALAVPGAGKVRLYRIADDILKGGDDPAGLE